MSEDIKESTDQVAALRHQCDLMGLKYHHKHGVEKLAQLINEHNAKSGPSPAQDTPKTEAQIKAELRRKCLRLHRVMITCNDPSKNKYKGEIFQAANAEVAAIRKYCPFGNANGWYMPKILLNVIEEKQFRLPATDEADARSGGMTKAYNVIYMDDLTPKQLEDLKHQQALARARG